MSKGAIMLVAHSDAAVVAEVFITSRWMMGMFPTSDGVRLGKHQTLAPQTDMRSLSASCEDDLRSTGVEVDRFLGT